MTGYVKCVDSHCPSRKSCYRFFGSAGPGQAYNEFNRNDGDVQCAGFMVDPSKVKRMLGGQRGGQVTRSKKQQSWAWRG